MKKGRKGNNYEGIIMSPQRGWRKHKTAKNNHRTPIPTTAKGKTLFNLMIIIEKPVLAKLGRKFEGIVRLSKKQIAKNKHPRPTEKRKTFHFRS
jgi:hypothetical protein